MTEIGVMPHAQSVPAHDTYTRFRSRRYENARRHAVSVILLIYLIIVLEGLLRKYLLPDLQQPLIFLRDPVVLYLYIHALRFGLVKKSPFLAMGGILLVMTGFVVVVQLMSVSIPFYIILFGLRQYFSLLLLPFIMAAVLQPEDLRRFFRLNLALLAAMAPWMVLQVWSPVDSWINTGRALDEAMRFGNLTYGQFVRATGFFTSALGPGLFLPMCGAVLLFTWIVPKRERICSQLFLIVATIALIVATAVYGSRTGVVGLFLVWTGAALTPLILPSAHVLGRRAVMSSALILVAGFAIAVAFFPAQLEAQMQRFAYDNAAMGTSFSIFVRAFGVFGAFLDVIPVTPLQGFGIGIGSNGYSILIGRYASDFRLPYTEGDWERNIVDLGPFVGALFIAYRVALTAYLGVISARAARLRADIRPWLLFSAAAPTVIYGFLSGQTTASGFGWFSIGIILAAASHSRMSR